MKPGAANDPSKRQLVLRVVDLRLIERAAIQHRHDVAAGGSARRHPSARR
jgi:hypothetical protein